MALDGVWTLRLAWQRILAATKTVTVNDFETLQRASDFAAKHTVRLTREHECGTGSQPVGSAVLIRICDDHIILMSAHGFGLTRRACVPPSADPKKLDASTEATTCECHTFVIGERGAPVQLAYLDGFHLGDAAAKDPEAEDFDVAAMRLDPGSVEMLGNSVQYLRCSDLDLSDVVSFDARRGVNIRTPVVAHDGVYIVQGFPVEDVVPESFGQASPTCYYGPRYCSAEPPMERYDASVHFALAFDVHDAQYAPGPLEAQLRPAYPDGISGCGMWCATSGRDTKLVAIQHTWNEKRASICGTRMSWVLGLIYVRYAHLRACLDILPAQEWVWLHEQAH